MAPPLPGSENSGAEHTLRRIGVRSCSILRRTQHELLKVIFPFDGVEYGVEGLLTEWTLGLVLGPLVDAAETELVQAAVKRSHIVEAVEADGAFGIRRHVGQ